MNNSTWGGAPEPGSGPGPFQPYDPWAGQAVQAPDPYGTQDADALRTQVIPAMPADPAGMAASAPGPVPGGPPADDWAAGGDAGSTRAQQHPGAAGGVDPHGGVYGDGFGEAPGTGDTGGADTADDVQHTAYLPVADPGVRPPADSGAVPRLPAQSARPPVSAGTLVTDRPEQSGGDSEQPAQPKKSRAGRNLPAAIGVGLGLGAAIVGSLLTVPVIFVGIVILAVLIGLWELSGALKRGHGGAGAANVPLVPLGVGSIAMLIAAYARGPEGLGIATALTALAVMIWRMTEGPEDYLRDTAAGVFSVFYLPFLASFAVLMLADDDGAKRVLVFMIAVVCSDTGAYAAGVLFGKHKMAPTISPGKTWEGFSGAVATCAVAGALSLTLMLDGQWWQGALLGAAVAATAALGDLVESMIKRDLGVKDMGDLLPGHGGVMDRLDSLLASAPAVWLLLEIFL
jgi:phosphatidate cytidylyltransferase